MRCLDDKRFVMTLKLLKTYFINSLLNYYPETEIISFFYVLTQYILVLRRIDVSLSYNNKISKIDIEKFQDSIDKLKIYEPIQYIVGETEFYNLPFKVNDSVLIPRPETEGLVDWIINTHQTSNYKQLHILDIGTGSGCIAISLAKNLPNSKVFGLDVSKEALDIAKQNAKLNNLEVKFIEADILNCDFEFDDFEFDIIVSNPPYVRELEKEKMSANVLKYEPHLALFVENEDSLLFYKKISQFANKILSSKGQLFFEINEYLGKEMFNLLKDEEFVDIELKADIFEKDRMIKGIKL